MKAGAVIGVINGVSPSHVHFGINPGRAYPHDNNPYRGHTYVRKDLYGYVDPVAFLRSNPRAVTCVAPALPKIASVSTTLTPLWTRTAAGSVWWAIRSGRTATRRWVYGFSKCSAPRCLETSETVPANDTACYITKAVKSPAPAIRIYDRVPRLSLKLSKTAPAKGAAIVASGRLTNAAGKPFTGARITLEYYKGGKWRSCGATYTSARGAWSLSYRPDAKRTLRAKVLATKPYSPAKSATAVVAPKA